MTAPDFVAQRVAQINDAIARACKRVGRVPEEITVVAAIKKQPLDRVQSYIDLCNQRGSVAVIAENYVQEWRSKRELLKGSFKVHLIGALQRNKAKDAVMVFDLIQAVHSEALAIELNKAAAARRIVMPIYLQINISDDQKKSGFSVDGCDLELYRRLTKLSSLRIEGLMTVPRFYDDVAAVRPDFAALRQVRERFSEFSQAEDSSKQDLFALSMGMSHDFEIAIEEGATHIRVGTALFGERP